MWWKIYFYILVIAISLALVGEGFSLLGLQEGEPLSIFDYYFLIVLSLSIYGLYCYIFIKKKVSNKKWKYLFLLLILAEIISFADTLMRIIQIPSLVGIIGTIIDIVFSFPLYYALYQLSRGKYRKLPLKK